MTKINEQSLWVPQIYQIDRQDTVEGGESGIANIQAKQLADRTTYLRNLNDSLAGMALLGEGPYTSAPQAQADINAGRIPLGTKFGVRSTVSGQWVQEYQNIDGVATPTGEWMPSGKGLTEAIDSIKRKVRNVPSRLAGLPPEFMAGVAAPSGQIAPFLNKEARVCWIDARRKGRTQLAAAESQLPARFMYKSSPVMLPDGAVCSRIYLNKKRQITEAYTQDGAHYIATDSGLKRIAGDTAAPAKNINYSSSSAAGVCGVTRTRLSVDPDPNICYIIVIWGQSLAQGWNTLSSDVLIATDPLYPDSCFMFKSSRGAGKENPNRGGMPITELEPLKETINGGWKETAASSTAAHVVSEVEKQTGHRIRTLSFVAAEGGKPYMELTKGTPAWQALMQGLIDAREICERNGWKPVFLAVDVMAGESDSDQVTFMTTERYKRQLQQFDGNIQAEARRIFNQASNVPVIISQSAFTPTSRKIWDQPVRQAQFEADGVGNIRLAGPVYPHPSGDTIHINSLGQNRRGQAVARAIVWECFGTGWRTIKPTGYVWKSDTVFQLPYEAPRPPLVIDKTEEVIKTEGLGAGMGYIFDDYTDSPPTIISVKVVSNTLIEIELSKPPAGSSCRLGYAIKRNDDNTTNQDGPIIGARGAMCDSTAHISLYENKAHPNWCPAYIMNMTR
ncbi:hypothetical protein [Serratia proteamaculans]|uniref:hypothetical protein n=1 Tax=Serratia proteamaculans TaxID=28151 RepID=UPI002183E652|nr:hypothetical protein [Serratia proteamaculans]CAI2449467.1 Uncharacterised protein [Serratia proteamaculans]